MADTIGFGTVISYCATQSGTYVTLAKLIDVTPPVKKRNSAKTTNNDSASQYTECLPAMKEGGEPSFKFNYAKAQHATLDGLFEANVQNWWKITLPEGSVHNFQGHITELGNPAPMEERLETDVKIMITGKPTFTAGS
jgi:hypothetical protein